MSKEISGTLVLNEISEDGGSTWKVIVCETESTISHTRTSNEVKTKCGPKSSSDRNPTTVSGSGVAGGDLSANQVSYQRIAQLADSGETFKFRRQNSASGTIGAGEITYALFDAQMTTAEETSSDGEVTQFNWTVTATGSVDLEPGS